MLLLSCTAALVLAGCGVKGPLEVPKGAASDAPKLGQSEDEPVTNAQAARDAGDQAWGANPYRAGGINPQIPGNSVTQSAPAPSTPKKSFFLDFLL